MDRHTQRKHALQDTQKYEGPFRRRKTRADLVCHLWPRSLRGAAPCQLSPSSPSPLLCYLLVVYAGCRESEDARMTPDTETSSPLFWRQLLHAPQRRSLSLATTITRPPVLHPTSRDHSGPYPPLKQSRETSSPCLLEPKRRIPLVAGVTSCELPSCHHRASQPSNPIPSSQKPFPSLLSSPLYIPRSRSLPR